MIKDIKELTFDADDMATLLCDNGLMITIDFVPASQDVKEGYITRITNINGECLETKYWAIPDALTIYIRFVDGLSIKDNSLRSAFNK